MIDKKVITQILPHRPPFLFVDRITTFNGSDRIEAELYLSSDLPFFSGHFPGRPVMPGVLVTEALAQTAGLLIGLGRDVEASSRKQQAFFLARAEMKYLLPAIPGETLSLRASLVKAFGAMFLFAVEADNGSGTVAKGSLALAGQDQPSKQGGLHQEEGRG